MLEKHNFLLENGTQTTSPAFAHPGLSTLGSSFDRSGNLGHRSSRSLPCVRFFLAAIASLAAITALVLFCSRAYTRRAVHGLPSRKLAKSDDSEALVRTCAGSSDEAGEQEFHGQPLGNVSVGTETNLPLKKRLLARVAGTGKVDLLSSSQQQRQQLTPTEVQTSTEFGLHTGVLVHGPHQHAAGHFASQAMQTSLQALDQQPPPCGVQPELHRLQKQLPINPLSLQQQHSHALLEGSEPYQQHQHLLLQWQEKQLQQSLLHLGAHESLLQKQGKQLLQPTESKVVMQHSEQQQALPQKRQPADVVDVSDKKPMQGKRKREEQTEPNVRKEQVQLLVVPEYSEEDTWLDSGTLGSDEPEHSKEQTLKVPTEAAVAGPSTSAHPTVQAAPGSSVPCIVTLSADTAAGDSGDETSADLASGTATAKAAAAIERPHTGLSSAASMDARRGMSSQVPVLSRLLTGGRLELEKEKREAGGPAGASATPTSASTPSSVLTKLPSKEDFIKGVLENHPYARLPTRVVETVPVEYQVNLQRAVSGTRRRRHPIRYLQRAHNLLLMQFLFPIQLKELAQIAEILIAHAIEYQDVDVSGHITCRAVERLALRFLIMDVVVSTMIVLGQSDRLSDNEYWNKFTSAVSHAGPPPIMRYYPGRPQFFSALAQQLTCAIQTLKTGTRPSPKELVKLKRKLFCLELSPVRLQTEEFKLWRQDDVCGTDGL